MVEINLLPWRQYVYAKQQKQIKYILLGATFFFAIIFILIHVLVLAEANKVNFHLIQLQNQLAEAYAHSPQKTSSLSNTAEEFYSSQKRLTSVLEKMLRADVCHIQLSKINFMEKSIFWVGYVRSAYAVACWVKAFRHTPIQKFKVENTKDSNFQKISFIVE